MSLRKIQATAAGYGGAPVTLFSTYNPASKVLAVAKIATYRTEPVEGCLVVTNVRDLDRDEYCPPEEFQAAIRAYFELAQGVSADGQSSRIVISSSAKNANPAGYVQLKELNERGPKYEVKQELTNAVVAVLITCWHIISADVMANVADWTEDVAGFTRRQAEEDPVFIII